jgi:hypothetical protein
MSCIRPTQLTVFQGATGGAYGPDDNYINAARALQRNSLLLCGGLAAVVGFLAI